MDERILKWLFDIKFAIAEIDSYFETTEKTFIAYQKNNMRKRAVERNLVIIGEAVNRIIKRDDTFIEKNFKFTGNHWIKKSGHSCL